MRVITITIPYKWSDVKAVDHLVDEFQSEFGHLCNGEDEWTDRTTEKLSVTVLIKDNFDPTLGSDLTEAVQDFEQVLASHFEVETP